MILSLVDIFFSPLKWSSIFVIDCNKFKACHVRTKLRAANEMNLGKQRIHTNA